MKKATLLFITFLIIASCGGTQYRDPARDRGSREWGPKEIKDTVNLMVKSLYSHLKANKRPAYLQVKKIRNRTSEHIDTKMLADEITSNLIQRRIRFLDPTHTSSAIKEMEKGMTGMVDPNSAIPVGKLKSPNFYLYGSISDNVRYVRGRKVQYLVVTLKLTSLTTGVVAWQLQKQFLKSSRTRNVGW
ncbi:hypothetical protein ACFL20_02685 [Spirochaetota bacterium]